MRLIIKDCNDKQFILYIIKFIKQYLTTHINYSKLHLIDRYISTLPNYTSSLKKYIYCKEIIFIASYNIRYTQNGNHYEIFIDNNQKLYGLNVKLIDACKLINYGNLDIQGYSIFTDTFDYVAKNIQLLYEKYTRGF